MCDARHVDQRVAREEQEVTTRAGADYPELLIVTETPRCVRGRGMKRRVRRKPGANEQTQLFMQRGAGSRLGERRVRSSQEWNVSRGKLWVLPESAGRPPQVG